MINLPLRIGIVGCGRVAENHVKALSKCETAVLIGAAGGRNAENFTKRHNIKLFDVEQICESNEIDILLVLTPPSSHFAYASKALLSGKHVLIEKPVSFNEEEIIELMELAKKKGKICFPGHSYIYLAEIARICRVAREGEMGEITYFHFSELYHMPPGLIEKYESPEVDVLCHQLYLSLAIAGIPSKVSSFTNHFEQKIIETEGKQIVANLKYNSGTLGQIVLSWAAEDYSSDPWTFKIKVVGTDGSVDFSRRSYSRLVDGGVEQPLYQEMFDSQMHYFINECIRKGHEPLSTIEDALMVCRLHNAIVNSAKNMKVLTVVGGENEN